MKRLLTLVAFFATLQASAQQVNPVPDYVFANRMSAGRNTVTDTAAYFSIGPRYGATRGMMPPMVVDTASFSGNKRNGLLIFSIQKNKFLYWDSVGVKWAEMAGTGGTAISSGDTAAMLLPYVRHAGYGLTKSSQSFLVDTLNIATRAWRQKGVDSVAGLSRIGGSGANNYVAKFTASSTLGNSIIFDNGTRIGIGLDTPDAQLTVQTVASFADGLVATPSIAHRGDLNTGIWFPGTDILAFSTAGLERMRFTSSGRLLIGKTTEGTFLLDVNGGIKADGGIIESNAASPVVQSKLNTADAQVVRIYMNGTDGVVGVTRNSGTVPNLTFATEGGERMRLTNSAELYINTTSDAGDYKLQVSGNIYNTGSITTGAPSGGSIKPWKIGEAATVSPTSPNRTIRVEIDGTVYYLHAKTTND